MTVKKLPPRSLASFIILYIERGLYFPAIYDADQMAVNGRYLLAAIGCRRCLSTVFVLLAMA
jgi:hypothetical protein